MAVVCEFIQSERRLIDKLMKVLLLASASPQRRDILENLGFQFQIIPAPEIDEDTEMLSSEDKSPEEIAENLAKQKSLALMPKANDLVLTADTVVALDGKIYGKPSNDQEASQFLSDLSGLRHQVITAIALRQGSNEPVTAYESTDVYFAKLTPGDIAWYVSTGEPFGKAGAYGIQGKGGIFIPKVDGCYFNVVGLPVFRLLELFKHCGYDYRDFISVKGGGE